ncbi:MAG: NAD-dependent epimerase/dehydratase family protein [Eubacteriales bacterium]|nr:NAD-dependent epimerase/dehydratase family protein [Eubacteriales bacterium]
MRTLVLGGTRFFGKHLVRALLRQGDEVTIATRGRTKDDFGDAVEHILTDRTDALSLSRALSGRHFDAVCDDLAYCSNDMKVLLDTVTPARYVMVSSASVYDLRPGTPESDFDPLAGELVWCGRSEFSYDIIKQHAERALFQAYPQVNAAAVRFPFVVGEDDYTNRLYFYVEHAVKGIPMYVDNADCPMALVKSDEAGAFLAHLTKSSLIGPVNGASSGTVTVHQVLDYVRSKTGREAILSANGDPAPYNGAPAYWLDTAKAQADGFAFSSIDQWIAPLLDAYITREAASSSAETQG